VNGITIIGREWVADHSEPTGSKEIVTFSVADPSLIDSILTVHPNIGNGSFALCLPAGVLRTLLDGVWI